MKTAQFENRVPSRRFQRAGVPEGGDSGSEQPMSNLATEDREPSFEEVRRGPELVPVAPPLEIAGPTRGRQGADLGRERSIEWVVHLVAVPLAAAITVALLADGAAYEGGVLAFLAYLSSAAVIRREARWAGLLPFMAVVFTAAAPLCGTAALALVQLTTGAPGLGAEAFVFALLVTCTVSAIPGLVGHGSWSPSRSVSIAVIGSPRSAQSLARELALARAPGYVVVGRVAMPGEPPVCGREEVPTLGTLDELSHVIESRGIQLLLMTGEVPRLSVFEELTASCLHLPVRLWELTGFYEDVFGHVPITDINASWFQYILHPNYRSTGYAAKRVLDVAFTAVIGLLSLPLMLILALLIRRDGGPVLFRQPRIGESGRPFTVYKLRTMRVGAGMEAQWAEPDDERITRIGRILRRSHLDEFPQLVNVLRGEMSLVGPRPEQPEFVDRLEQALPFYQRRHLSKPGITGWAQVRCGYAGSDMGSAWKLCHDLYYIKHRSIGVDLVILGETVRTLFADRQYAVKPKGLGDALDVPGEHARLEPVPAAAGAMLP